MRIWSSRCAPRGLRRSYCSACHDVVEQVLGQYVARAVQILATVGPLSREWSDLNQWLGGSGVPAAEAAERVARPAFDSLRRYVVFAEIDGAVTDHEVETFHAAVAALGLQPTMIQPLADQLARRNYLDNVRAGRMPTVSAPLHLPIDERCHFAESATRWRRLASGPAPSPGQLVVTNRKIRFVAHKNGGEVTLSKVHRVNWTNVSEVVFEATTQSLSGSFQVRDPELVVTIVDTAVRIDRRIVLSGPQATRSIPQHVKAAVWQRDGGRCRQCGDNNYLEFDHIIPFAQGGATSETNLQLLCRRCNQQKGNRI